MKECSETMKQQQKNAVKEQKNAVLSTKECIETTKECSVINETTKEYSVLTPKCWNFANKTFFLLILISTKLRLNPTCYKNLY